MRPKTLQLHPSLWCNLLCKHCYSNSGPVSNTIRMELSTLLNVITDACEMGYEYLSVSGGEPMMYAGIEKIVRHAKGLGMRTSVTTNATTITKEKINSFGKTMDVLAISLDGSPEIHNRIRGSKMAFELLLKGLKIVKDSDTKFGFIHTFTQENWSDLLWVADFAAENGASLLQLHPLELVGRANTIMPRSAPDDDVLARVYIIVLALAAKFKDKMKIQFDAFRKDYVKENPELVYASDIDIDLKKYSLSDLLDSIVVEANGSVVPVAYGFSTRYALCNLNNSNLRDIWPNYVEKGSYSRFRQLCKQVFNEISVPSQLPFFSWYELIVKRSYDPLIALQSRTN